MLEIFISILIKLILACGCLYLFILFVEGIDPDYKKKPVIKSKNKTSLNGESNVILNSTVSIRSKILFVKTFKEMLQGISFGNRLFISLAFGILFGIIISMSNKLVCYYYVPEVKRHVYGNEIVVTREQYNSLNFKGLKRVEEIYDYTKGINFGILISSFVFILLSLNTVFAKPNVNK